MFKGWSDLVENVAERAHGYLGGPGSGEIIAVIALLDLYGPTIYPSDKRTAADRVKWGVEYLSQKVNHPGFRMYFAVHELEAWILGHPQVLPSQIVAKLPNRQPETINFDRPPSVLLDSVFHSRGGTGYRKTTHGHKFFSKLDPSIAATKCPHLDALLNDMLSMARAAGL